MSKSSEFGHRYYEVMLAENKSPWVDVVAFKACVGFFTEWQRKDSITNPARIPPKMLVWLQNRYPKLDAAALRKQLRRARQARDARALTKS